MLQFQGWLNRLMQRINRDESGIALVMAMVALLLGALMITPTLSYMVTALKSVDIHERKTHELYAADAGIEYAIWCIKNDLSANSTITVNGIDVDLTMGALTELPYGPVFTGDGDHVDWILVYSEVTNNGDGTFTYTVHISNQAESGEPPIKLDSIGVGLPDGFTYVDDSSSGVTDIDPLPDNGKLTWNLGSPKPEVDYGESVSQTFLIEGIGIPEGYYSWVDASRQDVCTVSTCTGYQVISQAAGTTIMSYVVKNDDLVYPASWTIY